MEANLIKLFSDLITALSSITIAIIGVVGFVIAVREYCKTKKDTVRNRLAKDAYAFYFVEKQAIETIADLRKQLNNGESLKHDTIQKELRSKSVNQKDNELSLRPKMSANTIKNYITD